MSGYFDPFYGYERDRKISLHQQMATEWLKSKEGEQAMISIRLLMRQEEKIIQTRLNPHNPNARNIFTP